jgi:hypothetical protein
VMSGNTSTGPNGEGLRLGVSKTLLAQQHRLAVQRHA